MQRESSYEHRVPLTKAYSNGHDKSKSSSAATGVPNRTSNGLNGSNGIKGGFSYSSGHGNNIASAAGSNASTSTEDGALCTVDHLATFTVGESYELVHARDGLRRLREMEKSSGIWTQRMYLRVESNWVVIIDYENGDTVERFPMELVSEPTHFISQDPKELYNNILLFTVKEDPRSKGTSISEMHIFHCMKTSADKIADSIALLMRSTGTGLRRSKNLVIPPPPSNSPPEPPSFASPAGHVKEKVHTFNNILVGNYLHQPAAQDDDIESQSQQSDSTNYERDVAVLNHCFDDIERFIARLQYASAAYKELERRRRQRKSKKKEAGDGMLLMRARPPAEMEFVDIFQKFKLSFNLLAKLRSHIHDPNAPELIHFLFTPLALVVDASHDAAYGPNLAARVVPPLLTQEAKQLLLNCLTSKESDLWASLGEAWTLTRSQWPVSVPTYYPAFHDGWEPNGGSSLTDGGERARNLATSTNRVESWKDDREYEADSADYPFEEQRTDYQKGMSSSPSPRQYSERDRDRHSDFSDVSDNDFERRQRRFAVELETHNAKRVVQVQYPRTGKNDKELTVQQGEILEVINDSRKWWQTRNSRGQVGYVPHTIVAPVHSFESTDDASYPGPHSQRKYQNGRSDR